MIMNHARSVSPIWSLKNAPDTPHTLMCLLSVILPRLAQTAAFLRGFDSTTNSFHRDPAKSCSDCSLQMCHIHCKIFHITGHLDPYLLDRNDVVLCTSLSHWVAECTAHPVSQGVRWTLSFLQADILTSNTCKSKHQLTWKQEALLSCYLLFRVVLEFVLDMPLVGFLVWEGNTLSQT